MLFLFNTTIIDSNSDKKLIYDVNNLYEEDYYLIYFKSLNSKDINKLKKYDMQILSYLIEDKKYYVRNSEILLNEYTKNMNIENKIYYEINGIKIDAVSVICTVEELIKLKEEFRTY